MNLKVFLIWSLITLMVFSIGFSAVTITFWYALGGYKGQVFKSMLNEFAKEHPDIKINALYSGHYSETAQKVIAAIASKTLPNGGLIPAGPLFTGGEGDYTVTDYIYSKDGLDLDDFYPVVWDYAKYRGKICAIPFNISTPIMLYNKDLLKKAGLDPNTPPTTWQELIEYAKEIVKNVPGTWGINMKDTPWIFKAMLFANGGSIIDPKTLTPMFNRIEGIEVAEMWKDLIDKKLMPVGLHQLADKEFFGNTLAFYLGSSSRVGKWYGKTNFSFGTAFLPKIKKYAIPIGGATLVLFHHNKTQDDATWKLIKWLVSTDNIVKWSEKTGYVPIRKSAVNSAEMQDFLKEHPEYRPPFEQLKYGSAYWHFESMGNMDGFIWEALDKIERGVETPTRALDEAADKLIEDIKTSEKE